MPGYLEYNAWPARIIAISHCNPAEAAAWGRVDWCSTMTWTTWLLLPTDTGGMVSNAQPGWNLVSGAGCRQRNLCSLNMAQMYRKVYSVTDFGFSFPCRGALCTLHSTVCNQYNALKVAGSSWFCNSYLFQQLSTLRRCRMQVNLVIKVQEKFPPQTSTPGAVHVPSEQGTSNLPWSEEVAHIHRCSSSDIKESLIGSRWCWQDRGFSYDRGAYNQLWQSRGSVPHKTTISLQSLTSDLFLPNITGCYGQWQGNTAYDQQQKKRHGWPTIQLPKNIAQ